MPGRFGALETGVDMSLSCKGVTGCRRRRGRGGQSPDAGPCCRRRVSDGGVVPYVTALGLFNSVSASLWVKEHFILYSWCAA